MKISGSKNMGFKQFALKHSEKAAVVLIALIVLLVLTKTEWATIETTPEELSLSSQQAREKVVQSQWTLEERNNHLEETGWQIRLADMKKPIPLWKYISAVPISYPLRPPRIDMQVPNVLSLESLRANPGRVFHELKFVSTKAKDDSVKNQEKKRNKTEGAGFIPPSDIDKKKKKKNKKKDNNQDIPGGLQTAGPGVGKTQKGKHGEKSSDGVGRRYIVVVGVFDLNAQLKEFTRAMGLPEAEIRARNLARIVDIKVQRLLVDREGKPLTDWIDLDIKNTRDILKLSTGFEQEIIDSRFVNGVLTCPLPSIVPKTGKWEDNNVIHPDMSVVDKSQQEIQKKIDVIIREFIDEENRKKKKGIIKDWGSQLTDDDIRPEDILKDKDKREAIIKRMLKELPDGDSGRDLVQELVDSRIRQSKLMFRFFDFDVQPHQWYQHRVKIVMSNPLRRLKKANRAASSKEAGKSSLIESAWSKPTPPTSTGNDYSYYLTDAKKERSLGSFPSINVELYQWIQKYGMSTKAIFSNMVIGNPIGGSKETEIPEPLYDRFDRQLVTFHTENYLVDIDTAPNLGNEVRASLSLSRGFYRDTGITEQITVIDEYGHLKVIDKLSLRAEREVWRENLEMYHERFADLRDKKKKTEGYSPGPGVPGGGK